MTIKNSINNINLASLVWIVVVKLINFSEVLSGTRIHAAFYLDRKFGCIYNFSSLPIQPDTIYTPPIINYQLNLLLQQTQYPIKEVKKVKSCFWKNKK